MVQVSLGYDTSWWYKKKKKKKKETIFGIVDWLVIRIESALSISYGAFGVGLW